MIVTNQPLSSTRLGLSFDHYEDINRYSDLELVLDRSSECEWHLEEFGAPEPPDIGQHAHDAI